MWRGASLRLLLLALLAGAETPAARPLVLVCVCGQQGRLLLEPLTARLLRPNLPSHRFHLRFHLQRGPVHFSTDLAQPPGGPRGNASGLRSAPSPFAAWGEHRTRAELGAALQGLAELVTVRFWDPAPEDDWRSSVGRLDVVWLYRRMQDKLLNTWRLQQNCAAEALANSHPYQYVVSTREDLYLLQDLSLARLEERLEQGGCGIVAKGCNTYGGIDMHLQLMRAREGLPLLRSRIDFYRHRAQALGAGPEERECGAWCEHGIARSGARLRLVGTRRPTATPAVCRTRACGGCLCCRPPRRRPRWCDPSNPGNERRPLGTALSPEEHELAHAANRSLRPCGAPIEELPALAARPAEGGGVCFNPWELGDPARPSRWCLPGGSAAWAAARLCTA
eukprot:TRINITY_DN2468_c1_g1_i9.p1 TRINITY_DN2468_c1_g1~~TRINITY_DN2468_c1_g1_i9.p1  ORF type:complete len:420 (+),score=144.99 TRINITY_DN2468_c1_g1_i9:82-1260(+)